jgi:hypothetical protein
MTNKELELIGQLTEVATIVAELRAENKILKDVNEKLIQALRKTDVIKAVCDCHLSGKVQMCNLPDCHGRIPT